MLNPGSYYLFNEPKNRPIFFDKDNNFNQRYFTILNAKASEMVYVGDIFYKQRTAVNDNGKTIISNQLWLTKGMLYYHNFQCREDIVVSVDINIFGLLVISSQ